MIVHFLEVHDRCCRLPIGGFSHLRADRTQDASPESHSETFMCSFECSSLGVSLLGFPAMRLKEHSLENCNYLTTFCGTYMLAWLHRSLIAVPRSVTRTTWKKKSETDEEELPSASVRVYLPLRSHHITSPKRFPTQRSKWSPPGSISCSDVMARPASFATSRAMGAKKKKKKLKRSTDAHANSGEESPLESGFGSNPSSR